MPLNDAADRRLGTDGTTTGSRGYAIFFPADLHLPCSRAGHRQVRKEVVKTRA